MLHVTCIKKIQVLMKRLFVNIREKDNFEDLGKMGDNTKIYICDKVCGYTNKVRQAQNRNERKVLWWQRWNSGFRSGGNFVIKRIDLTNQGRFCTTDFIEKSVIVISAKKRKRKYTKMQYKIHININTNHQLSHCYKFFIEKLVIIKLIKNFPAFINPL